MMKVNSYKNTVFLKSRNLYYNTNGVQVRLIFIFFIGISEFVIKFYPFFFFTPTIKNPQPEKEIKGRYLPTKLYFTDNLNILNDSTFVGRSIDMNYGSFFIYNSRSKEKRS